MQGAREIENGNRINCLHFTLCNKVIIFFLSSAQIDGSRLRH